MTDIMDKKRILILGVGNTLLADEGFGVHAVEYLQKNYDWPANVRLMDGGTLGLMLMAELLECDLAIILDIALGAEAAGTFYRITGDELDKSLSPRQSAHQTGIADTLLSCELAGHRPDVLAFAMQPYDFRKPQADLTPEAREQLPVFCGRVVDELARMGIKAESIRKAG